MTLERVDGANHTRSWNTDPGSYEQTVSSFLARVSEQEPSTG